MKAAVQKDWLGQDVCIIGGGASLKGFEFSSLTGLNTIGVNDAFRLGPPVCRVCLFGDVSWWNSRKWDLERYAKAGGVVYSVAPELDQIKCDWLRHLRRVPSGLVNGDALAWNFSTGAAAVNLAHNLGAFRIFLLGFDMVSFKGETHWHRHHRNKTSDASFQSFIQGFTPLVNVLKQNPAVQVYNVGPGISRLPFFPKITFPEMEKMRHESSK